MNLAYTPKCEPRLEPSCLLAFGDDNNDIGILSSCGTGVTMGNAIPEVKAASDAVTKMNDEDGVAVYLDCNCWFRYSFNSGELLMSR